MYAAQTIPQIDAEIAEKGHFWMETSYCSSQIPHKPVSIAGKERFQLADAY
jgi:hypothetical protein